MSANDKPTVVFDAAPVNGVSDPAWSSASGPRPALLNENWNHEADFHILRSRDATIYPGHIVVGGSWSVGQTVSVQIVATGLSTLAFSHVVQSGDTNSIIANALKTQMAASAPLIAAKMWVQAVYDAGGGLFGFGICPMWAQWPMTLSNVSSGSGTVTFTQPTNILDGPLGLHIMRLPLGRSPVAGDHVSGLYFWGKFIGSGDGGDTYSRVDTYIVDPAAATRRGRVVWGTIDANINATINRISIEKGVSLADGNGVIAADMGAGNFNLPAGCNYYINGVPVSAGGGGGGSTVSFKVDLGGTSQGSIPNADWTKIEFNNVVHDPGGFYNTTTRRWTPPADRYDFTASLAASSGPIAGNAFIVAVRKNGTEALRYTYNVGVTGAAQALTLGSLSANGTDYFEVFTYMDGGGSGKTISGNATSTYFEAHSL